jgi:hypothetical protein
LLGKRQKGISTTCLGARCLLLCRGESLSLSNCRADIFRVEFQSPLFVSSQSCVALLVQNI